MIKQIGKVIEVFIPDDSVDSINSRNIGFKVELNDKVVTIIEEQNSDNSKILKDSMVVITTQTISGKDFIDVESYEGDVDE